MIFAFVEGGTLEIYETAGEAIQRHEGLDVESGTVRFYDEAGVYLEPRFSTPNRKGNLFGLFGWVNSGVYELVANPQAGEVRACALRDRHARAEPMVRQHREAESGLGSARCGGRVSTVVPRGGVTYCKSPRLPF
jgi:hypothetical protein